MAEAETSFVPTDRTSEPIGAYSYRTGSWAEKWASQTSKRSTNANKHFEYRVPILIGFFVEFPAHVSLAYVCYAKTVSTLI